MPKRERIPEAEKVRLILLAAGVKNPKVEYLTEEHRWRMQGIRPVLVREGISVFSFAVKTLPEARQHAIRALKLVRPDLLEGPEKNRRIKPGVLRSIMAWEKDPSLEIKPDEEARGGGLDRYRARKVGIKLVFEGLRSKTPEGIKFSFPHPRGRTFTGEIHLPPEEARELKAAIRAGFQPCFWIFLDEGGHDLDNSKK